MTAIIKLYRACCILEQGGFIDISKLFYKLDFGRSDVATKAIICSHGGG